jgi:hypothetical protein
LQLITAYSFPEGRQLYARNYWPHFKTVQTFRIFLEDVKTLVMNVQRNVKNIRTYNIAQIVQKHAVRVPKHVKRCLSQQPSIIETLFERDVSFIYTAH